MSNRLEIEVGADIKDFNKKLADSLKGLDKLKAKNRELEKSFKKGEISQDKYYSSLAKNTSKLKTASNLVNKYKNSLNNTDKGMNSFSKGAANGASAMTAFSRTVQDAPFGLMGVSNNITNLTEQFGYLKAKTGSSGGALKAMLKDLKGFGGITLGISLATSALLIFGDKLKATKTISDEFNESLKEVSTSGIVEFKTLTDVMLDVNSTQKDQAKALSILKEKYSDFDTSILTTKGNYEDKTLVIKDYIKTLVQQAKAQAALSLIEKKQAKIIALEEKKMLKMRNSFGSASVKQFEKRRQTLLRMNNKQLASDEKLRKQREDQINARFDAVKNMGSKEIDELKTQIETLTSLTNIKDLILFGKKTTKPIKDTFVKEIKTDFKINVPELIDFDSINSDLEFNTVDWESYYNLKKFDEQRALLEQKSISFTQGINNILGNSLSNTFSQLGESLGAGIKSVDEVITQGLGGLLSSMGDYLIKAGTAAVLAGTITKLFGSIEGVGAGFAAIAGGVVLKGVGSGISSFGGAGNSGNTTAGQGSSFSSGSTFTSGVSSQTNQGMTLVLRGEDMYGAMSAYVGRNKNLGTNLSFT